MSVFGKKRHEARQRREELNHRVGVSYGMELFRMDCPRPAYEVSTDRHENAFRVGVQVGYSAAEMEYEDEVGWFLREQAEKGLTAIYAHLAEQPWPTDDGPLDIHGGDGAA